MVQGDDPTNDGAEEQMLSGEENDKLNAKRDEVKFIKGDHQNGDAKIDIGALNGKTFTGMTKEELMKYANDPFWIRLRWICFVGFWAIWLGMLVGAILIILNAPKCSAPKALPWFKSGLLAAFNKFDVDTNDIANARKLQAHGAIYELPADLTYSVHNPDVEEKIKNIVDSFKGTDINVILDITPNFVTKDSEIMKNAIADRNKRSALIWIEKPEVPNNWLSIVNGSAWKEVEPGNFVLSQFGDDRFDLHMNDTIVKKQLGDVLTHLIDLGVKGFRFKNTKFFILSKNIQNEVPTSDPKYLHNQYGFWTHSQTTFQEGLGEALYEYQEIVKNKSSEAFLSVADDIVRPESYQIKDGELGVDLPQFGRFTHSLSAPQGKNLMNELVETMNTVGNTWLQWNLDDFASNSIIDPSALSLFVFLLPGAPVVPVNADNFNNISAETYTYVNKIRQTASYMHGAFNMYSSANLVAYSRIKSGNPGYFVVFNPTEVSLTGNFSSPALPPKMSVDFISENFNVTDISIKSKVATNSIEVSSYATVILTYVPVK